MIGHPKFAWVHIPKCAGRSVFAALADYPGVTEARLGHFPAPDRARPVLACVRSPWEYYASAYSHLRGEPVFRRLFRGGGFFPDFVARFIASGASLTNQLEHLAGWKASDTDVRLIALDAGPGTFEERFNAELAKLELPSVKLEHKGAVPRWERVRYDGLTVSLVQHFERPVLDYFDYPIVPRTDLLA